MATEVVAEAAKAEVAELGVSGTVLVQVAAQPEALPLAQAGPAK